MLLLFYIKFQFQVIATDDLPFGLEETAIATVTIGVTFDSPPVFLNAETYNITIFENLAVGGIVFSGISARDPDSFSVCQNICYMICHDLTVEINFY